MMNYKPIFTFFCALAFTRNLQAQVQDSLTVDAAIAYALRNNYDILLSKNDSAIAAINYNYRNAAFLPRLNANGTLLFNNNAQKQTLSDGSVKDRTGIQSNALTSGLNVSWTVFDGFRMFILRNGLSIALRQGNLTIRTAVLNTVANVITTYYDVVRQRKQLQNVEEQISLARDRQRLAQYKFDIGVGIKPDVLQAQIDLNNSIAAQLNQLTLIEQREVALNQLMNIAPAASYKVSDTIPSNMNLQQADFFADVAGTNPLLQLSRANIEAANLQVQLAKAARYPTVSLVTAYNYSRTSNNTVINQFSPLFNLNRGFNYGIQVSVPILNNFSVRQQIQQAKLAVDYQELQYKSQELLLNTSLLTAFKNYAAQKNIVAVLDSNIAFARENLFIERERYRVGITTFIELRQAEENVSTTITNLINAQYNLKVSETELLRLRGDLVR